MKMKNGTCCCRDKMIGLLTGVLLLGGMPTAATANGEGFLLGGTAQHAQDPENPANQVIRISTIDPPFFGTVSRALNVKIAALDNQLETKSYFVPPKTCVGGSPRMQLAIDLNGDGVSDGNAFGYVGSLPFGSGCPSGFWFYTDFTDVVPRWDVTQLIGPGEIVLPVGQNPFTVPWDLMELLITLFPNHRVCTGQLTDDTFGIPGMSGIAYYDLISIGNATWSNFRDTSGRGFARGCGRGDDGDDDDDDGDDDRDGDVDDDDDRFDDNRRGDD